MKIAKRYSDNPTVAAYDLLNEPLRWHNAAEKYAHLVEPLYRRITTAIRAVDTNHMITLEGVNWSNDWSIFGEPFGDNVFYQFHYYCWNRPDNLNDISHYINMRGLR
ncbi:MAG: cellulase family glycosylhydrolase [Calditrichia bacterium]